MSTPTPLTLKQIAADLQLPEATVRYYRDALEQFIPSRGTGRGRRYPPEAVGLLQEAAELVRDEQLTLQEVADRWASSKAINAQAIATTTTSATEQQHNNSRLLPLVPIETLRQVVELAAATGAQATASATAQAITQGFAGMTTALLQQATESATMAQDAAEAQQRADALQKQCEALRASLHTVELELERERNRPLTARERLTGRRDQ